VAYLLKARTVKPAETAVARERLRKCQSGTDSCASNNGSIAGNDVSYVVCCIDYATKQLQEEMSSVQSVLRLYKDSQFGL
jgi:hypothetical protein